MTWLRRLPENFTHSTVNLWIGGREGGRGRGDLFPEIDHLMPEVEFACRSRFFSSRYGSARELQSDLNVKGSESRHI